MGYRGLTTTEALTYYLVVFKRGRKSLKYQTEYKGFNISSIKLNDLFAELGRALPSVTFCSPHCAFPP